MADEPPPVSEEPTGWVVNGDGPRGPIISVHSWHSDQEHDRILAAELGNRPVVSLLRPRRKSGGLSVTTTEWVDRLVTEVMGSPFEPPYRFIGSSLGGYLAVEVAKKLEALGCGVRAVGMLDTVRPRIRPLRYLVGSSIFAMHRAASIHDPIERNHFLAELPGLTEVQRQAILGLHLWRVASPAVRLMKAIAPSAGDIITAVDIDTATVMATTRRYEFTGFGGDVTLWSTAESRRRFGGPLLRWPANVGGTLHPVAIPGGHGTLFDPSHAATTAEAVAALFDDADDRRCLRHSA